MKIIRTFLWAMAALVAVISFTGCVAIPPLVNVHHSDSGAKSRLDDLERRVRVLEQKLDEQ